MSNKLQHQAEEARQLAAIFEHSRDGIITIDTKGIVEKINPAAARLFQYNPAEVIGQSIKMLMPEPFQSKQNEYIQNYLQFGIKKIIGIGREVQGKQKNGTVFPFLLTVSEEQLDNRTFFIGFIQDFSEKRKKEKELEESRNKFEAIFETAVDSMIIINERGLIEMTNPATTRLFGYDSAEMLNQNINMLMPEPYHSEHDTYISNYHKTRIPKIIGFDREVKALKKDGTIFPINLGVSEVKLKDRTIYTGIIHDLTKQRQVKQQIWELNQNLDLKVSKRTTELADNITKLLVANKQLEYEVSERKKVEKALQASELETRMALEKERELNEMKSRFVTMASHEFRTPLSTILSSISLIGRYNKEEHQDKKGKHIDRIKSAVNNLTAILNDFLSLGKLEAGKIKNSPETFPLNELCLEVSDEIQGLTKPGQQIIHTTNDSKVKVHLDKLLLKNILFNLLTNSIKYSHENKNIYCTTNIEESQLIITIKDEGIGIPEKDQEHLFDRFFRATNVTNIQGTGLGLNIIKKYVELLDGQISFTSKEGVGSTFVLTIPLTTPES